MDFELAFSVAGLLSMLGWAALAVSPLMPTWSTGSPG